MYIRLCSKEISRVPNSGVFFASSRRPCPVSRKANSLFFFFLFGGFWSDTRELSNLQPLETLAAAKHPDVYILGKDARDLRESGCAYEGL